MTWQSSHPSLCCDFCHLCTLLLSHPAVSHVLLKQLNLSPGLKE